MTDTVYGGFLLKKNVYQRAEAKLHKQGKLQANKSQKGAVAKLYMRKGFLIYEQMRKFLVIYEEAVSCIWLCNCSLLNYLNEEIGFSFYQCKMCKN